MLEEITGNEVNWPRTADSRPAPPLAIEVTQLHDRTCVRLYGELDDASVPPLRDRLANLVADLVGDLVLDIAGLSFEDSTGLGLFVTLHKNLESRGRQFILFGPTPMARRILEITGLNSILRIEPNLRMTGRGAGASEVQ
jgi:anti-anti-sigma factor